MIKCSKCHIEKDETEFYKRENGKYRIECKKCIYEKTKSNRKINRDRYLKNNKKYYKEHKEKIKQRSADWYKEYKDTPEFKLSRKQSWEQYKTNNIEKLKEKSKLIYKNNKQRERARLNIWAKNNPDKVKQARKKLSQNPQFKIRHSMSSSLYEKLKKRNSSKNFMKTIDILGYSVHDLMQHLELQFEPGMSWDNYGEWEIDHIVPDSWFSYQSTNDEGFKQSFALSNLQPMWMSQNVSKGNRYSGKYISAD